jgi:RimJ/RimL family protein N-acetyltransferase
MNTKKKSVKLNPVTKSDYLFLFELLSERDIRTNISHKKMPTFEEHVKFIKSKPYAKWYIINEGVDKIGSIYLSKQNEIGLFLKKQNQKKGVGITSLNLLMKLNPQLRYLANVNPKNSRSKKFFEKLGFELIQHTYELVIKNENNSIK